MKIIDLCCWCGGFVLWCNLLVFYVLNNVLILIDLVYCMYRLKVEIDMDIDVVENEFVFFDKLKMMFNNLVGFDVGNVRYIVCFVVKLIEKVMEME